MRKMKYIFGFLYTAIATVLYFKYFYKEDISRIFSLTIPVVLYMPILLSLTEKRLKLFKLNIFTVFAFCIGFILIAFTENNNIWPIALVVWLVLSVPSILILNLVCYVLKRKTA